MKLSFFHISRSVYIVTVPKQNWTWRKDRRIMGNTVPADKPVSNRLHLRPREHLGRRARNILRPRVPDITKSALKVFPRNGCKNRSCYWSWRYITATEIQSRRCIFCWLSTMSRKDLWLWWHLHNQAVKLYLQFSLPVAILTSMPPGMWQGHRWASSIKTWMAEGSGCSILCEIEKCNWGP